MNRQEKPYRVQAIAADRSIDLPSQREPGAEAPLDRAIVSDSETFRNLAADWNRLLRQGNHGSVFMRWEWHFTWWQVYAGKRDHLHIITWRRNGELVGLLPLYRQTCGIVPGCVCLRLLGTGELSIDEVATEYGDLLVGERLQAEIGSLAADYLQQFDGWTQIEMSCLLEDSVLYRALLGNGGNHVLVRSAGQRYRRALERSEADYLDELCASRARRIRRSQRAAQKAGGLVATPVVSLACFEEAFRELAELNHERQAYKRRKSVFASARFRQFHLQLSRQLFDHDAVDLVRFHLGSRLLAVLYCFYDSDTCYYYQSGFARRDSNRYMPLTLAHLMEMQRSRSAGRRYYDFMRGEPPTYKDELECEIHPMVDVSVYRWRWLMHMAACYRRLRTQAGRTLRQLRRA